MRRRRSKARKARFERDAFSSRKRRQSRALKRRMLEGDNGEPLSDYTDDLVSLDMLYGPLAYLD